MQSYRFPSEIRALFLGFSCDTHKPNLLFISNIKIKNHIYLSSHENKKPKQLAINCLGYKSRIKVRPI